MKKTAICNCWYGLKSELKDSLFSQPVTKNIVIKRQNEIIALSRQKFEIMFSFDKLQLNHCKLILLFRYNSTTGKFTVPSGKGGLYFFSMYIQMQGERGVIQLRKNGLECCAICTVEVDHSRTAAHVAQVTCSGLSNVVPGK